MSTSTALPASGDQRTPLMRVAALVVPLLLVSLLVLSSSRAAFTGETSADGAWDTATVELTNDAVDGVEFSTSSDLVPGDVVSGQVTVTYSGSAESVDVELFGEDLDDPAGLASQLHLTITDDSTGEATYTGTVAQFAGEAEGVLPWTGVEAGAQRTYTIEVAFDEGAGNDYIETAASVTFVWQATTNPTHGQD